MGLENRRQIINEIQGLRGSTVITHFNSDRRPIGPAIPGLTTKLATEAQPYFIEVLRDLGQKDVIDFFLFTSGGQTDSVWPLVSLIREYCKTFNVIVPYKAHSAGTLICLGADELVLTEYSELSPVDPATGNQFNPMLENGQPQRKMISVEDVTSYFSLSQNPSKLEKIDDGVDVDLVFKLLAKEVHPLALGNVNRSHTQIRELAKRLLESNNVEKEKNNNVANIVNTLTQGRYSHTDILNRHEVKELLGENVVSFPDKKMCDLIWKLHLEYKELFEIDKPFALGKIMGNDLEKKINIKGSIIESNSKSIIFRSISNVTQRSMIPTNVNVQIQAGQPMPIFPGFPKEFHIEMEQMGWSENQEGI